MLNEDSLLSLFKMYERCIYLSVGANAGLCVPMACLQSTISS